MSQTMGMVTFTQGGKHEEEEGTGAENGILMTQAEEERPEQERKPGAMCHGREGGMVSGPAAAERSRRRSKSVSRV